MSDSIGANDAPLSVSNADASITPMPWAYLRAHTSARIALGRAGGSLPTRALLDFNLDQALARDAVHAAFDAEALVTEMRTLPGSDDVLSLQSAANDRQLYLQRPDLGRKLLPASVPKLALAKINWGKTAAAPGSATSSSARPSIAIMVSDGLSALAAQTHAVPVLRELLPRLHEAGFNVAPLVVIRFGRVGIMDEVGAALGATLALILLGERPGLGAPDSLSAYFTFHPAADHTDADRNCVSNIRDAGLTPINAAVKLTAWLIDAVTERYSGVKLKEPSSSALTAANLKTLSA